MTSSRQDKKSQGLASEIKLDTNWSIPLLPEILKNNKDNNNESPMYGFFNLHSRAMLAKASNQFAALPEYKKSKEEYDARLSKILPLFLECVAYGKQDKAESILKNNPELLLYKGKITDYSNRSFENITALQYVEWARDWRMRDMLLKYIDKDLANQQINEVHINGVTYKIPASDLRVKQIDDDGNEVIADEKYSVEIKVCEHHFDMNGYLNKLKIYADNCGQWSYQKSESYWSKVIGWAQRLLPAHIAQEYCQPARPFDPIPDFSNPKLVREFKFFDFDSKLRTKWYPHWLAPGHGTHFAIIRAGLAVARGRGGHSPPIARAPVLRDLEALTALNQLLEQKFHQHALSSSLKKSQY